MPRNTQIELKRHYLQLSEKETDEVVKTVADMIVNYVKECGLVPAWRTNPPDRERRKASEASNYKQPEGKNH